MLGRRVRGLWTLVRYLLIRENSFSHQEEPQNELLFSELSPRAGTVRSEP